MSIVLQDFLVKLGMDVNRESFAKAEETAKKTAENMKKGFTKVGEIFQSAGKKIQDVGGRMTSVGGKLTKSLTMPIVGVGAASVKAASDFEGSFAKLMTIADTSSKKGGESVGKLKDEIAKLSDETGMAQSEIASAAYDAISAGQKTNKAVSFVSDANKLAKAGFTDLGTSTNTLTTIMNSYGKSAGTAEQISDKLITTQNLGKTTVNELGSSMGKVIPTAAMFGVNLDQLSAAYVTTTKNGIATAESTTYINSMMNELGKGGTKAAVALQKETGKSFKQMMDDGASLGDVAAALQRQADKSGGSIADMFSSQEGAKAASILVQHSKDFDGALKQMGKSANTTSKAFKTMKENDPSAKMNKMKTAFQNAAISIGEILLPVVGEIVPKITGAVNAFKNMDKGTQRTIVKIAGIAAVVGPAIMGIGKIATAVGKGVSAFGKIIGVVGKVGGLFIRLGGFVVSGLATAIPAIVGFVAAFWPIILVVGAVIAIGVLLWKNWDKIKGAAKVVGSAVSSAFNKMAGVVKGVGSKIASAGRAIGSKIKAVGSAAKHGFSMMKNAAASEMAGMKNAFVKNGGGIKGAGAVLFRVLTTQWRVGFNLLNTITGGKFGQVVSKFKNGAVKAATAVKNGLQKALNFLAELPGKALSYGADFIEGLIKGIKSKINGVIDSVKGIGKKIKAHLHFSRPDEGPLRDYETWMPDFMKGMAKGIRDNTRGLFSEVGKVANGMSALTNVNAPSNRSVYRAGGIRRSSYIRQNVTFNNSYSGSTPETQRAISKTTNRSASDATTYMARALSYARG